MTAMSVVPNDAARLPVAGLLQLPPAGFDQALVPAAATMSNVALVAPSAARAAVSVSRYPAGPICRSLNVAIPATALCDSVPVSAPLPDSAPIATGDRAL